MYYKFVLFCGLPFTLLWWLLMETQAPTCSWLSSATIDTKNFPMFILLYQEQTLWVPYLTHINLWKFKSWWYPPSPCFNAGQSSSSTTWLTLGHFRLLFDVCPLYSFPVLSWLSPPFLNLLIFQLSDKNLATYFDIDLADPMKQPTPTLWGFHTVASAWSSSGPGIPSGFSYLASTPTKFAPASWNGGSRLWGLKEKLVALLMIRESSLNSLAGSIIV